MTPPSFRSLHVETHLAERATREKTMATITISEVDPRLRIIELVLQAQDGDREAFGELFERFERHVYAIALRRLGDHGEAQEQVQEVFIQAMQKISQLRQPEAFGGWLRSITHRMAINRAVRRSPTVVTEPDTLEATVKTMTTPEDVALAKERDFQVREGLDRLRTMDRETLEAFYLQGHSLLEMSDQFEAPLGTIKRRLHVARKRLAKEVEELVAI